MLVCKRLRFPLLAVLLGFSPTLISAEGPPLARQSRSISLLVLKSGRFAEGRISQSAGGYVVEKPNGSMVVPFELVDFSAVDRHDAYLTMRSRLKPPTPTRRMALARWCLTHGMYKETEAELRTVLEVDPGLTEARKMLERLEAILYPKRARRRPKRPQSPARTADGFTRTTATSLAGLKSGPAREFVATIQPILMNKCGNARCHGSAARNRFRLTRVRTGFRSHRVFVERNLAAVLREIDRKRPSQSRLLTIPKKGHGRGGRAIFFGRGGTKQYRLLRNWTLAVASSGSPFPAMKPRVSGLQQATAFVVRSPRPAGSKNPNKTGNVPVLPQTTAPRLKPVPPPPRSDPFDPNLFNRAVHGQPGKNTPVKHGG